MQNLATKALGNDEEAIVTSFDHNHDRVQGLWALVASSKAQPQDMIQSGTLSLQAGKILGGHFHRAYAGTYVTQGEIMNLRIETWLWHPISDSSSLFDVGPDSSDVYNWAGSIDPVFMSGELTSDNAPGVQLTAALIKICNLDGAY